MNGYWKACILVALSCCMSFSSAGQADEAEVRASTALVLQPDVPKSFATITETVTIIGIHGDDWAIQFQLPSNGGILRPGTYPVVAELVIGHGLERYITPPAGVPTPPLPRDGQYQIDSIEGLTVTAIEEALAYEGPVDLKLSAFRAGIRRFAPLEKLRIDVRCPCP